MAMKNIEKKLLRFYRDLSEDDQHALLRYAEFLAEQQGEGIKNVELAEPVFTAPKLNETVVGALKRLSASYPMLDKAKMLDQTSTLMSDHLMRGKAKEVVIQEFEALFAEQYQLLKREIKSND